MYDNSFIYLFVGAIASTIGAVPFGLVNLSVVNVAVNTNIRKSMPIAYGASFVEILFAIAALLTGSMVQNFLGKSFWIKITVFAVLLAGGIFFFFKKNETAYQDIKGNSYGFLKGALLNLMSIQVLLFWIIAVTFLSVRNSLPESAVQILLFVVGVWIAKMAVLRVYAFLAKKVVAKSQMLSKNINRIIGVMLIVIAFIQFLKF